MFLITGSYSCFSINRKRSISFLPKDLRALSQMQSNIVFFSTGELSGSEGEEGKGDNDAKDDGISSSASSVGENDATDGELSSSDAETGHKKKDKKKHKHKKKKKHKEKDKEKSKRKRTHSRFVLYIFCEKTWINEAVINASDKKETSEKRRIHTINLQYRPNMSSWLI